MPIWIMVCVNKEFGADNVSTFVFTDNREAIAAVDSADINCHGWHSLHFHNVEVEK